MKYKKILSGVLALSLLTEMFPVGITAAADTPATTITQTNTSGTLTITLVIGEHEHSWGYSAGTGDTANVITATCNGTTGTCSVGDQTATLTLDKSSYSYGDTITPTVTLSDGWTAANGFAAIPAAADVKYIGRGTTTYASSSTAPTNVGTYTAQLTVGTVTATVNFEITAGTISASAENVEVDYDGGAHGITVNVTAPTSGTTITYGNSADGCTLTESPTITNVADSPKTVYYKVTAPNYADKTGSATITINKASQTAPDAPTKASATTSSITLTAITNGQYSKDGTTWQDSPTFTSLTMNTSYTFYQRIKGDANHDPSPASTGAQISTNSHAHSWNYSATGATITASCTGEGTCNITTGKTLTISAPTNLTYSGQGKPATLNNDYNTTAFPGTYTISYTKQGDTSFTGTPTDAGTYTASVTVGTATASVTYQITAADITITTPPTASAITYGQTLANSTLSGGVAKLGETEVAGTFAWKTPTTAPVVSDSNTTSYAVTFTPNSTNYNSTETEVKLTVNMASQSAPFLTSENETIEGKADGKINGLTTAMEMSDSPTGTFTKVSDTSGTGYPAGTYYVRYAGDANHIPSEVAQVIINVGDKLTVQFNADGGTPTHAQQQLTYHQTAVKPETDPTKTGHTFKFWSADGTSAYDFSTQLEQNITLKAVWQVNQYTIEFNTAGGSAVAPITQDYGTAVTAPANPTKAGFTFGGWTPALPATMPADNMTVKAVWNVNGYAITFDTDGGSEIAPISQNYGTPIAAPAAPTKEGYTFVGWDKPIPSTMPAESITIKALWKINQYTITFDTVGGSAIAPITQDYGTAVTTPAAPTKEGYTFAGWYPVIPATMPASNTTVTAMWTQNEQSKTDTNQPNQETQPYYPTYYNTVSPTVTIVSPTNTTPTTNTNTSLQNYNITGTQTDEAASELTWDAKPDAKSYSLYIKVNGKNVFIEELGNVTTADIVRGANGKYYVSTGGDYDVFEYKNGKFVKTGTLPAEKIGTVNIKNDVTNNFVIKYTKANGKISSDAESYKASVKVYYKPAVKSSVNGNTVTLRWNSVPNAEKYRIYTVDKKGRRKLLKETDKSSFKLKTSSGEHKYAVSALVNGEWTMIYKSDLISVTVE